MTAPERTGSREEGRVLGHEAVGPVGCGVCVGSSALTAGSMFRG